METGTPAAAAPQPEARISALGRITGALFSPGETFADIARKPSWVLPVILSTVMGLCVAYVMTQRVDWPGFFQQQNARNTQMADMPAERRAQIEEAQLKWGPLSSYAFGGLIPIITVLFWGAVYLGAFNLMASAGAKFKQCLAIVAHAELTGLLAGPLIILVLYLKEGATPENMLASSVGAVLPEETPRWLLSIGTSVEVFTLWTLFLVAIGFSAVNPKKVPFGTALGIVGVIWVVWVMFKAGLAALGLG